MAQTPASVQTLTQLEQKTNEIKSKMLIARKTKDKATQDALGPLLGDIDTKIRGKEPFDVTQLYSLIKGHISGVVDCKRALQEKYLYDDPAAQGEFASMDNQLKILSELLPQPLTSKEMTDIVSEFVKNSKEDLGPRDMGKVMAYFKAEYPGKYDGKVLSGIVKEFLQ